MNKTILITLLLVFIGAMLIGASIAYWQQGEAKGWETELYDQFGQEMDLAYLILQMEHARDTHQYYIDHPEQMTTGLRMAYAQRDWVNIYDQVIEVLRSRQ